MDRGERARGEGRGESGRRQVKDRKRRPRQGEGIQEEKSKKRSPRQSESKKVARRDAYEGREAYEKRANKVKRGGRDEEKEVGGKRGGIGNQKSVQRISKGKGRRVEKWGDKNDLFCL